ncbi:hypothetical protein B0H17DRAFT_1284640 [Mycena rosella]|uniref:Uncharacterized protein n=1 Tax=Mycena rosella TaxID=1033263 RepID=A0AAD7GFF0_MYCRO|nr:hypothetical protein B0H17DRAFT_1284640 [Mycena rosella]
MSAHDGRFRIPGGSLDLDFDDDHESGLTAQGEDSLLISIQAILVNPTRSLSRTSSTDTIYSTSYPSGSISRPVLDPPPFGGSDCRVRPGLEYVRKRIPQSRPFGFAYLARIQSGVLPCAPPPVVPIQDGASQSDDRALLPLGRDLLSTDPIDVDAESSSAHGSTEQAGEDKAAPDTSHPPLSTPEPPPTSPLSPRPVSGPSARVEAAAPLATSSNVETPDSNTNAEVLAAQSPVHGPTEQATTTGEDQAPDASLSTPEPSATPLPAALAFPPAALASPPDAEQTQTAGKDLSSDVVQGHSLLSTSEPPPPPPPPDLRPTSGPSARVEAAAPLLLLVGSSSKVEPLERLSTVKSSERPSAPAPSLPAAHLSEPFTSGTNDVATTTNGGPASHTFSGGYCIPALDRADSISQTALVHGSEWKSPENGADEAEGRAGNCPLGTSSTVEMPSAPGPNFLEGHCTASLDRAAAVPGTFRVGGTQGDVVSDGSERKSPEDPASDTETRGGEPANREASIGRALYVNGPQDKADLRAAEDNSGATRNLVAASVQTVPVNRADDSVVSVDPGSASKVDVSSTNQIFIAGNPKTTPSHSVDFTTSFTSQTDPETPESCTSASFSILETPLAPRSDHVDSSSRLDIDLLQFSPFSFSPKLAHDECMSLSAELFKDDAGIGADASLEHLMTGSCEEQSEFDIGCKSEEGAVLEAQHPNRDFQNATGCTSTPFSVTAESHALGGEGTTLPLDENSYPVAPTDDASALVTDFGRDEAGVNPSAGSRSDTYFYSRAGDFLRSRTEIDNGLEECAACGPRNFPRSRLASPSAISPSTMAGLPAPAESGLEAALCTDLPFLRSPGGQAQLAAGTAMSKKTDGSQTSSSPSTCELRPPLLAICIPISPTSFGEELSQLSPLFSPIAGQERASQTTPESSAVERLFSERSFSVSRTLTTPIKLKRGTRRMQNIARHSRGTDTSDAEFVAGESKRVFVDACVQTDQDVEEDGLRRRIKALERELRSLRAAVRRSEERVRETKPRSFWKKVASPDPDRVVPPPEPVGFGFLKDMSWSFSSQGENSGTTSGS